MIVTIDVSAAVEVVMGRPKQQSIISVLEKAEWTIAPSLYIYETANVMWKYNKIQNYTVTELLHKTRQTFDLVDQFIKAEDLYEEAMPLACKLNHPAYDTMYLIACRRKNATLLSLDSILIDAAHKIDITVISLD